MQHVERISVTSRKERKLVIMSMSVNGFKKFGKIFLISTLACCSLLIPVKSVRADAIQPAIWFMDDLNITQVPGGDYSHAGTLNFDVKGVNNTNIKAPFDCEIVEIFYGEKAANTVIIQSTSPVRYADGTVDFMSMAVGHDNDISDCYIGKIISQGEVYCQNGNYGNATGVHSHVTCIRGKYTDHPGWVQVSTENWTFQNAIDPTTAFFLHASTNVVETMGLNFQRETVPPTISDHVDYHLENGTEYFYFSVTDNLVGVDPNSVKVKVWEYGLDESKAVVEDAQPTGTTSDGGYTASAVLTSKKTLYFAKIVASDKCGNFSEAVINPRKPIPFFPVDKSSCAGIYRVTKDCINVYRAPYEKINGKATFCGAAYKGNKLRIIGSYKNTQNKEWYQQSNGLWVHSEDVKKLNAIEAFFQNLLDKINKPEMYFINNQAIHTEIAEAIGEVKASGLRSSAASSEGDIPYEEGSTIRFSTRRAAPDESIYGPDSGVPLHTITFHANNGQTDYESMQVYEGNTYGVFPEADRYGYTFTGWYTDPEAGEQVMPTDTCTQDIDLYAHWLKVVTASGSCGDNLTWELDGDGLLKIMGSGSMTSAPWYTDGYCQYITEVSLPEGLDSIYNNAFKDSNLLSVTFPQSLCYIGREAFSGCTLLEGELTIPEGVTDIENGSFKDCVGITELTIPNSVIEIGDSAFEGCSGITKLTIPNSITYIRESTFSGCASLEGVLTIPDSVTSIGRKAFADCEGITELTIPDSVTDLDKYAFAGFTGLKKLTCPGNLSYVVSDSEVFSGCTSLESIKFTGEGGIPGYSSFNALKTPWYISSEAGTELTIEIDESITGIGSWAFAGCSNITDINIPETVTSIGEYAFYNCALMKGPLPGPLSYIGRSAFEGCSSLTGVIVLSDEVTSIGEYTFSGCSSLEGVLTIPNSVTWIGRNAFAGCEGITELTIPDSITDMGSYAFAGFTGLKKLTCPGNLSYEVGYSAVFSGCTSLESIKFTGEGEISGYSLSSVTKTPWYISSEAGTELTIEIEEGITGIGNGAFAGCTNITDINIPETVTNIGEYAFYNCSLMKGSLPGPLSYIGRSAFEGCSSLTGVIVLSDEITSIGEYTFSGCSSLEGALTIPDSVTWIGRNAFAGCEGITELTIPDSVTDIGYYAFAGFTGLKKLTCPGNLSYVVSDSGVFSGCTSLESIKFTGEGGIPGYSTFNVLKTPWYISSEAGTELTIEIEEGITEIGNSAFRGCSISTVYLPFSTDFISSNAFDQCAGLSDVYFDGSEMEAGGILIGSGNTELNSATWHYALKNPNEDLTLKLPDQLKVIEEEAFTGMSAEVIIIPASVETIKSGAFVGCADLKAIVFEGSPENVANDIVSNPETVTVFVIKDSGTEAWARQSGFRVKYNLNNE